MHQASSSSGVHNEFERLYFPSNTETVKIHSHIGSSPFVTTESSGIAVSVYPNPACPVESVHLSLDISGSLAKTVIRYRAASYSWTLAWLVGGIYIQLRRYKADGQLDQCRAETDILGVWFSLPCCLSHLAVHGLMRILGGVIVISGAQLALPVDFPSLHLWLLGTADIRLAPLSMMLIVWSFGVAYLLAVLGHWCFLRSKDQFSPGSPDARTLSVTALWSVPQARNADRSRAALDVRRDVPILGVFAVCLWLLPLQMVHVALVLVLLYRCSQQRLGVRTETLRECLFQEFSAAIATWLTALLPFQISVLLVWGRTVWMNWRYPFASEYNALKVLPVAGLVILTSAGWSPARHEW